MTIPRFTADASIGPTVQTYRTPTRHLYPVASSVHPQLSELDVNSMTEELGDAAVMDEAEIVAVADGGNSNSDDITVELDDSGAEDDSNSEDSAVI